MSNPNIYKELQTCKANFSKVWNFNYSFQTILSNLLQVPKKKNSAW